MFRKIVTELAYSPALAGNLGHHIKHLRNERSRRQIGLIFVFLAVVVQLFASLLPPESANANNPDILIDGGIQSVDEYLDYYDQNTKNIQDLLTSLGIARADLAASKPSNLSPSSETLLWSMQNNRSTDNSIYPFLTSRNEISTAFNRPLSPSDTPIEVFSGTSSQSGKLFAFTKEGGALLTEGLDTPICTPWFFTSTTQIASKNVGSCPATLQPALSARTIMPNTSSATPTLAHASERIAYTLSMTNTGPDSASVVPSINLEDLLEYSRILDNGGGEYDFDTKMLSWPSATLPANEATERSFIVQLLPSIPSTARGEFIAASYDCRLHMSFGNTIAIPVDCPIVKSVESLTRNLVDTPKGVNLIFAFGLLSLSAFLYARSRQLLTELYIIRHNHLGGL